MGDRIYLAGWETSPSGPVSLHRMFPTAGPRFNKKPGSPMDKNCPICFGIGWVCENHPDKAWDKELGCECGAGMPCECNDGDEPDTAGILVEGSTRH
jgi:hypothetical protein